MLAANIKDLALTQCGFDGKPEFRVDANWFIHSGTGAMGSTIVYFEVPAGHTCPGHNHTVEENIFIVDGTAEVTIGNETKTFSQGGLVVIPALERQVIKNVGHTTLKVLGFFPSTTVVSAFDEVLQGPPHPSRVVIVPEPDDVAATYPKS